MAWRWTPYTILPLMAAAALIITALYILWRRRHRPASRTGAVVLLACAELMAAYALEIGSVNLLTKVFWKKMQYVGFAVAPTMWLVYTLQYTGRERWLTRRTLALLSIVPPITLLLVFTNEAHGLIWRGVWLDTDGLFPVLDQTYGAGLWVFAAYSYILMLLATLLHVQLFIHSRRLYRWQASALTFATLLPWLGNMLDVFKLSPFPSSVSTALGLILGSLTMAWTIYRLRRRDILSVSRGAVIEGMSDGVVVLDDENRVVDLNPVAQRLSGHTLSQVVGQPMNQLWPEWSSQIEPPRDGVKVSKEVTLGEGDGQRAYDVRISPLVDWRGRLISQVVVLRDITERKRAEEETWQRAAQLEALQEVGLELTAQLDLDTLLRSIVSRAVELVGGDSGGLYLYRPEQDVLEWTMTVGPNLAPIGTVLQRGQGLSGKVWEAGEPLIVDDYQAWEGRAAVYEVYPFRAVVGVPVHWGDEFLGVLDVLADPPYTFSPEDAELLGLFAQQAAIAIENARLYEDSQRRLQEMNSLLGISQNIASTLELDEVLRRVIEAAIAAIGPAEKGTLHLLDKEREELVVRASVGFSPETTAAACFKPGEGYTGWVFARRQPVIIGDVKADWRTKPIDLPEVHEEKSALCAPLVVRDKTIGTLTLDNVTRYSAFTPELLDLLTIFANQAAIAIENARLYQEAERLAITDGLTGLYNRRYFYELLEREVASAKRYDDHQVSLIIVDTDNLKVYNDTYGHLAGDALLRELAQLLKQNTRKVDVVARYGGDEFVIFLPHTDKEHAITLAERIRAGVQECKFCVEEGLPVGRVTISLGVAACPEDALGAEDLVRAADGALFEAKRLGGNRVCV